MYDTRLASVGDFVKEQSVWCRLSVYCDYLLSQCEHCLLSFHRCFRRRPSSLSHGFAKSNKSNLALLEDMWPSKFWFGSLTLSGLFWISLAVKILVWARNVKCSVSHLLISIFLQPNIKHHTSYVVLFWYFQQESSLTREITFRRLVYFQLSFQITVVWPMVKVFHVVAS